MYQTVVPRPSEILPAGAGHLVAVDTETSGLHGDDGGRVSIVSVAWLDGDEIRSEAFPFDQGVGQGGKDLRPSLFDEVETNEYNLPEAEWDWLLDWLERQWLIFHNAKFDLHMLYNGTRMWPGRDFEHRFHWCTQLVQKELDPVGTLKLKEIGTQLRLLGSDEVETEDAYDKRLKVWLRKNKRTGEGRRYDLAPWDLIGPYAAQDTRLTMALYLRQRGLLEDGFAPWWRIDHQFETMRKLYRMENRGIGYNASASLQAADEVGKQLAELEARLPFRNTLLQAKKYFFETLGHPPYKVTPKGEVSLDAEVLRKLVRDEVPGAADYERVSQLEKAISMWYVGYVDKIGPDGRLRTEFNQIKVRSSRMSSTRMNLQAVPKGDKTIKRGLPDVRSFVEAREGYVLWNLDLSQAELRAASKMAKCRKMQQMLLDGADLHSITCAQIMGGTSEDEDWAYKRDIAKRLTFGGIFQIGPQTFKDTCDKYDIPITLNDSEFVVREWRGLYPEYGKEYRRSEAVARHQGWVSLLAKTPYETRSWFGPRDFYNTAWSRRVQGSLALFLTFWLRDADDLLQTGPPEVRDALVLTVHDSLVLELPDDGTDEEWAHAVAKIGADKATKLIGTEMKVDVTKWHK